VVEKVEIDPGVGAATLGATQYVAIKAAGLVKIGHVEGEVKKAVHPARIAGLALALAGAVCPIRSFPDR
jgi:hypothetical protein